jgi:hypothetical protein
MSDHPEGPTSDQHQAFVQRLAESDEALATGQTPEALPAQGER